MIDNLRLTTDRNTEQDWLKTNLARFTGMLQGQRDLTTVGRMLLSELAPLVNAQQGVIYQMETEESAGMVMLSTFAGDGNDSHLADSASETLDRSIELSLEDNADHLIAAIDAALGRLEAGTYGQCERCSQPIAEERLEALPWATKCIECKRLEERG